MSFTEYRTRSTQAVRVLRCCDLCGHSYFVTRHVEGWGTGANAEEAQQSAKRAMDRRTRKLYSSRASLSIGVLCPLCGEFWNAALRYHFPEGVRKGILRRLHLSMAVRARAYAAAMTAIGFLIGCLVGLGLFIQNPSFATLLEALATSILSAALVGLGPVAFSLWRESRWSRRVEEARDMLARFSDKELMILVQREYRQSGESLGLEHLFNPPPFLIPRVSDLRTVLEEFHGSTHFLKFTALTVQYRDGKYLNPWKRFCQVIAEFTQTMEDA